MGRLENRGSPTRVLVRIYCICSRRRCPMASSPAAEPCPYWFRTTAALQPGLFGSRRRVTARDAVNDRPAPLPVLLCCLEVAVINLPSFVHAAPYRLPPLPACYPPPSPTTAAHHPISLATIFSTDAARRANHLYALPPCSFTSALPVPVSWPSSLPGLFHSSNETLPHL